MRTLEGTYPLVVTERVAECRDFYVRRLGFEVGFEASWIVYLAAPNGHGIGFMAPKHPSRPPGSESFGAEACCSRSKCRTRGRSSSGSARPASSWRTR